MGRPRLNPDVKRAHEQIAANRKRLPRAYLRLGVDPSVVDATQITPVLETGLGSVDEAVSYLRTSNDPIARRFLALYDSVSPNDRRALPLEALCVKLHIDPVDLFAAMSKACLIASRTVALLTAAAAYPKIVKKTIEVAKTKAGSRERKMLLQHSGFLPTPAGQVLTMKSPSATKNG